MKLPKTALVLLTCLAAAVALSTAKNKDKDRNSVIEDGVLDAIELKALEPPAATTILVRRFSTGDADLGTAGKSDNENRTEAAKMIQAEGPRILAEALTEVLDKRKTFASVTGPDGDAPAGGLVVEGRFVMIDPGSRAKRYWGGFGAGKSGIGVEGKLMTADGTVLATFQHRRHSGMGIGGGDYVKFLTDDTKDVGHDIGVFIDRYMKKGNLEKEADD